MARPNTLGCPPAAPGRRAPRALRTMRQTELLRRSVLKAITYRLFIVALDFVTLYVLTESLDVTV